MGRRRKLRKTEVVFQKTDGNWVLSVPKPYGFKHTDLGTARQIRTRDEAERRALKVLSS